MKVNYPIPHKDNIVNSKTNDAKVVKAKHSLHSHGMLFENELNLSNEYYRNIGRALIYKKPTPVQIVKVDYPTRSKAKIVEGYYKTPSTTDYNGIYRGKYIDYEAKETNNLSFDFKHIFEHQVYGLAPTEIIYRIATAYILGFDHTVSITKHNLRQWDSLKSIKQGTLEKDLAKLFPEMKSVKQACIVRHD